jgi:hypothetical protein
MKPRLFAVVAPDTGKAVFEVTAADEFIYHLGNDGA